MSWSKKKNNHFLAMWDMYGLESLFDVNKANKEYKIWEKSKMWSLLKEEDHTPPPRGIPVNMLILRARFNSQRKYEIYEFKTTLTYDQVKEHFASDPNTMAKLIREKGYKIYSDRIENDNKQVVF